LYEKGPWRLHRSMRRALRLVGEMRCTTSPLSSAK
jgi:hypothetical protein